jgi:hypothetical protein
VIGVDPRGKATTELGEQGLTLAADRVAAALDRALAVRREPFAAALESGTAALERLYHLRQNLGRDRVPPVLTTAWLRHLEAFRAGEWERARVFAESKRADPAA